MALELTPLEKLSPAVERAIGDKAPPPMKLMAARGLAPLPPADLVSALYQLSFSEDETLKKAAMKTAVELPEKILGGALAEPLDGRVLDFFARRLLQKIPTLEIVLLNRATLDETYVHLAKLADENTIELIAKNEERLLRHPAIIAALYLNPKTRMSTAQRAVELAIRNNVEVAGLPAFEQLKRALQESAPPEHHSHEKDDAAFKRAGEVAISQSSGVHIQALNPEEQQKLDALLAAQAEEQAESNAPEVEEQQKKIHELSIVAKIRLATLGNAFARSVLIRDRNKLVSMAAIRSPAVSDSEVIHYASNRSLDEEIIRYIANERSWLRLYSIKVALCNNPKCPLPTAMRLLPHLRMPELKALSRSKGIPSPLATAAKQMVSNRS